MQQIVQQPTARGGEPAGARGGEEGGSRARTMMMADTPGEWAANTAKTPSRPRVGRFGHVQGVRRVLVVRGR